MIYNLLFLDIFHLPLVLYLFYLFFLLSLLIKSDKRLEQEEIEEKIRSNFKMKGLILADVKVVKLHDKNLHMLVIGFVVLHIPHLNLYF